MSEEKKISKYKSSWEEEFLLFLATYKLKISIRWEITKWIKQNYHLISSSLSPDNTEDALPLAFVEWYSGMERKKILRQFEKWKREREEGFGPGGRNDDGTALASHTCTVTSNSTEICQCGAYAIAEMTPFACYVCNRCGKMIDR